MFAVISWTLPALAWGLLATLLPLLVHLLLRPSPRRLRFPPVTLLRPALVTGVRASRWRNLALMLWRMALLAACVALLAGPQCASSTVAGDPFGPRATVFIIDESVSMAYRPGFESNTTLLDLARGHVRDELLTTRHWPAGSAVAVVSSARPTETAGFTADFELAAAAVQSSQQTTWNAAPLGQAWQRSQSLLAGASQPLRQIVVVTDGTAAAWRDLSRDATESMPRLQIRIVDVGVSQPTNLGITAADVAPRVWPSITVVPVEVALRSTGLAGNCWVVATRDGDTQRSGPFALGVDEQRTVVLELPPADVGVHDATLSVEPADLWAPDQTRHVVWQTGPLPVVWFVESDGSADTTSLIVRNLLAPEGLAPERQRLRLRRILPDEVVPSAQAVWDSDAQRPHLIALLSGTTLDDQTQAALLALAEGGSTVLLIPTASAGAEDWSGFHSLVCESEPWVEELDAAAAIRVPPAAVTPALNAAYYELSQCAINRRIRIDPLAGDVSVLAAFTDDVPAIVQRPLGAGRIVALTTAPAPSWSELGIRAAGLLIWLHAVVDGTLGSASLVQSFVHGQQPRTVFAGLPDQGMVGVDPPGGDATQREWIRVRDGVPRQPWPTSSIGSYTLQTSASDEAAARYAVNWPQEELDLTPLNPDALRAQLAPLRIEFEDASTEPAAASVSIMTRTWLDTRAIFGGLLLALFVGELLLTVWRGGTPDAAQ